MSLIALLNKEAAGSRRDVAIALAVSGVANAVILAVINAAAQTASFDSLNARYLVEFAIALGLYVIGLKYTFDAATRIFEQALTRIRIRLVEKIAGSELLLLHQVGKARIFQAITQETTVISEAQGLLVAGAHSAVMVACTAVYVMTQSLPAFLTVVAVVVAGALIYLARQQELMRLIQAGMAEEVAFVGHTGDLIDGLKEIKLSEARGRAVLADLRQVAQAMRDLRIKATSLYNANAVFSQCFFYVLIAVIVFVLPRLIEDFAAHVPQLVAAILFIIGPLSTIVNALPAYTKAGRAASAVALLEAEIDQVNAAGGVTRSGGRPRRLARELAARGVAFSYRPDDPEAFAIGPLDLSFPRGSLTMIVGGNGSGKTTFLKVLAGLYEPTAGRLYRDGAAVTRRDLQDYRELFSAIYTDFHLFRRLYGIAADPAAVTAVLQQMDLGDKVRFDGQAFSTLDLSTGQRKRIAMAVALLEDRPVLIFDEWAADQDPGFRRYFYQDLLPALKARGKTLIVATHDDRYFAGADCLVKMELGRIHAVERRQAES